MSMIKQCVGVLPLGGVPDLALKIIVANISAYLKLPAKVLPAMDVPLAAFNKRRLQYDAGILLNEIESMPFKDCEKVVGVLNEDLFVPIFAYVYGEAKQGGGVALASLFRLRKNSDGSSPPPSVFYERAAKVALHELGHLFKLFHCEEKSCLMHFSGDIRDLDNISLCLCRYCSAFFPA